MSQLTRTALAIDKDLLDRFDRWMAAHGYANRSEAVRDLIRTTLVEQEWEDPEATVVGILSIVFDHAAMEMAQRLTSLQHEAHHSILCSQHVHLDHHNCLEAIILKGKPGELRGLADAIIAAKGVKAGKLTLMSQNV